MRRRTFVIPIVDWTVPVLTALSLGAGLAVGQVSPPSSPPAAGWGMPSGAWSGYVIPPMAEASAAQDAATSPVAVPPSAVIRTQFGGHPTGPYPVPPAVTMSHNAVMPSPMDGPGCGAEYALEPGCASAAVPYGSYAGAGGCPQAAPMSQALAGSPIVWGGGAGALFLLRDDSNHEFFSYDSAIETNQSLDSREAGEDFLPGVEAHVARFNTCTCTGWEGVYWGVFPAEGTAYVDGMDVAGDLNAILNYDQLDYNGNPANAYVNDALVHRLRVTTEIHNVEINRLWGVPTGGCCSPWSVYVLGGFRYFDFDEGLQFAADTVDTMFTGAADELYYTIDCDNNLYGGQLGAYIERCLARRWSARFACKAGVYANDATAVSHIGGAAGTATVNNGPNDGREWYVAANKTDVAFLGEVHAGLGFQATQHVRLMADYRVLGVSGVALPTNQIFHDLRGLQDVELLATNGSLLLHGVFVGGQLVY